MVRIEVRDDDASLPGSGRVVSFELREASTDVRPGRRRALCVEQGGDPDSVRFCHELGLDYVSCSPFRVPTARLAAGQAAVGEATAASK